MKKLVTWYKILIVLLAFVCIGLIFSCEREKLPESSDLDLKTEIENRSKGKNNVVDVVTRHMDLQIQSQVSSGWNTFRYRNESEHAPHFFVIEKMPEGKTFEDSKSEIVPLFQDAMNYIVAGEYDKMNETFATLGEIEWYGDVVFTGGPGLVSPGHTAESTVYLEPGTYTIECYVKNEDNIFHVSMGMIAGFTVTDTQNDNEVPKATMNVNISSTEGITFDEKVRPGLQTIKVNFEDQTIYSHGLGHDVHLVELSDNADLDALNAWMNWSSPAGFLSPAPEGVTFMGGMQDLPAIKGEPNSHVGYFEAQLKPGRYAFISEVPDPMSKNMFKTFTVPTKD